LGISQNAYSKIENNHSKITIDRLKDIAKVFDVPEDELLNSETNVFNFTNNKTANGYAIYQTEKESYEEIITLLKSEIELLRLERKELIALISKLSK
jgi:transcriptional regulator with XRE-family HTH domain